MRSRLYCHALLAVSLALILCAGAPAQSSAAVAHAASVTGRVMLSNGNGMPGFALSAGYALNPGDQVDTRGGGRLVIDLSDGSIVIVQPETVLTIKDFRGAASLRELFQITLGLVRVQINHFGGRPNPYRMNSPTASIAVRGTEFTIAVDAQGETSVEVFDGAVEVSSLADPDRKVLIEAGRGVLVRPGQDFHLYVAPAGREIAQRGPPGRPDNGPPGRPDNAPQGRPDNGPPPGPPGMVMVQRPSPPGMNGPNMPPPASGNGPPPGNFLFGGDRPKMQPPGDGHPPPLPGEHDDISPRANSSTYDRYIASLTEVGQLPFLYRFNAFPEQYLDTLENPANATTFHHAEGRLFVLPTFSGVNGLQENASAFGPGGTRPADYSISPQFSIFTPFMSGRFVVGGNVAASHIANSTFSSVSMMGATRFGSGGHNSFGLELERLKGTGSLGTQSSGIDQTRMTAGFTRDLSAHHKLGLFFRYGLIDANETERSLDLNATRSTGHSSEIGLRLRGALSPRLSYGVAAAWLGLSLTDGLQRAVLPDSHQRDQVQRSSVAAGLAYALTRRTILSFDLAGGASRIDSARLTSSTGVLLQSGASANSFFSFHGAIQRDISRRLFVSASVMAVGRSQSALLALYADQFGRRMPVTDSFLPLSSDVYRQGGRFSDFAAGWRFSPNFFAQYVYSTDYGYSTGSHTLMLRYTFHLRRE